jgi:hypothetical protein
MLARLQKTRDGSPDVRVRMLHGVLPLGLLREARQHVVAVEEAREVDELALELREPAVFFWGDWSLEWDVCQCI